jgi:hypothetical protein
MFTFKKRSNVQQSEIQVEPSLHRPSCVPFYSYFNVVSASGRQVTPPKAPAERSLWSLVHHDGLFDPLY